MNRQVTNNNNKNKLTFNANRKLTYTDDIKKTQSKYDCIKEFFVKILSATNYKLEDISIQLGGYDIHLMRKFMTNSKLWPKGLLGVFIDYIVKNDELLSLSTVDTRKFFGRSKCNEVNTTTITTIINTTQTQMNTDTDTDSTDSLVKLENIDNEVIDNTIDEDQLINAYENQMTMLNTNISTTTTTDDTPTTQIITTTIASNIQNTTSNTQDKNIHSRDYIQPIDLSIIYSYIKLLRLYSKIRNLKSDSIEIELLNELEDYIKSHIK